MFLGMEHGQIRVCKFKSDDHTDLSDYWILSMHDNYNGYIPKMILSHDQKMLFTCGYDGNLFSYEINDDTPFEEVEFEKAEKTSLLVRQRLYFKTLLIEIFCDKHDKFSFCFTK